MNAERADHIDRIIAAQKAIGGICKFRAKNAPYLSRPVRNVTVEIDWLPMATRYLFTVRLKDGGGYTESCETVAELKRNLDTVTVFVKKEADAIGR